MLYLSTAVVASLAVTVRASLDLSFGNDKDLTSFVTRPEIKTPRFEVNIHDASRITPGYWFLAPYAMIFQQMHARKYYQPCQTGPSIFDSNGELVWSGACEVKNQNTCDFRAWEFNNTLYSSAILTPFRDVSDWKGHGIVMNNGYRTIANVHIPTTEHNFNMHELNLVDQGRKAIHIAHAPFEMDLSMYHPELKSGWILDVGFREVDLDTGELTFEWWAARDGHVNVSDSKVPFRDGWTPQNPWNWFHGNSVEKNEDGDYMLSSRFTDTIFKISGADGSILWRLGGTKSAFDQDFTFARQHDARWLSRDMVTKKERISFLDNSADESFKIRNASIARIIELDFSATPWTARTVHEISRPDNRLTRMRGNHQLLPSGNSFVCWSENAVISEHSPEGDLLMDAHFASYRFVTYRAYKFNFTSIPSEPIAVHATAYGSRKQTSTTVVHVSWNGATEVDSWRFKTASGETIGEKERTGFETNIQAEGYFPEVIVEAVARNGSVIGTSETTETTRPDHWEEEEEHISYEVASGREEGPSFPEPRKRLMFFSNEGLAICLFASTLLMLAVALWLWRCTNGGRASIRLGSDRSYWPITNDKGAELG